jgi:DNA-binding transcriptional regulator YdaS (Cro superfamily)
MDIFAKVGGPTAVARLLGITPAAITFWRRSGVPIERCVSIERATKGQLMRWDLRPTDWPDIWPELIGRPDAPPVPSTSSFGALDEGTDPHKEQA